MATKHKQFNADRIVVGAGPVGCLHAIQARASGQTVHLVDRQPHLGGCWRGTSIDGALFENGLHLVHAPARWNEFLFDLGEEIPVTAPVDPTLVLEGKSWGTFTNSEGMTPSELAYVQGSGALVQGGMGAWLNSLVQKYGVEFHLNQSIKKFELSDDGITSALTSDRTFTAPAWALTGSPEVYRSLVPASALKHHTCSAHYQPALVLQCVLRRPVTDLKSVLVMKSRMDHQERRFIGLFESNLDPSRAPELKQTCTWMCFLQTEDYEDSGTTSRWLRAMKRAIHATFENFEKHLMRERFLALPEAGGPALRTDQLPKKIPSGTHATWKNVSFLTHATASQESPYFWTTQQILGLPRFAPSLDSRSEMQTAAEETRV